MPKDFYRWLFVAACLWVVGVVGTKAGCPLVWDDLPVLAYNERLARAPLSSLFTPAYFDVAQEFSYRPVSTLLHWAGLRLWGAAPAGHRALELILHLSVAGLFVLACRRWGLGPDASWAAATVFVLHPIHFETLFCAVFNEEILVALLLLAAWLCRMRWSDGGLPSWLAGSAGCFALALLSKEIALLGLPALWVLERGMPRAPTRRAWSWVPYLAAAAAYAAARFWLLQGPQEGTDFPVSPPLLMRLYFAGRALSDLFRLLVAPLGLRIEYFAVPPSGAGELTAGVAGWLVAAVLAAVFWRSRGLSPSPIPGLLWAGLLLLPALNLAPAYALTTRYFAERWTYVPLLGLLLAAAAIASGRLGSRGAAWGTAGLAAWLAVCGVAEARPWCEERLLWSRLVSAYPWSAKAHEGLGEAQYRAGKYGEALASFETGMRLRVDREDRVLEYYIPLFESRAAGRPVPLVRETPYSHRWLARTWLALGRPDQAKAHLLRAEGLSRQGVPSPRPPDAD